MAGTVTFIEVGGAAVAKVIDGTTITGWVSSASVAANTDIFLTGTGSVSDKVSNTTVTGYALGAGLVGEPWDFSAGGGDDGNHIFMIAQNSGTSDTLANGGFGIIAADDLVADSFGTWYVGPQTGSTGGWEYFVINPARDFNTVTAGTAVWTTGGNPAQLTGVDGIGVRWKITNTIMGASDNAFVQSMSVGQGYRITGTDALFSEFSTYENTNRLGALETKSGVLFPLCKLRIGVASGAGNTTFTDSGFTVTWQGQVGTDSTSVVASGFYGLFCDIGSGTTDVTLTNGTLAAASPATFDLTLNGITSATITNLAVDRARVVTLDSAVTWNGGTVKNSGAVTASGSIFKGISVLTPTVAVDASAVIWNDAGDPDGNLDNCVFSKGTNAHHAIQLGASAPATVTLRGMTFTGFSAADANNDSVILLADTGSDVNWTVNAVSCSGTVSVKKTRSGDTFTVVVDPVTTSVHVQDINTSVAIYLARVWLPVASAASGWPYQESVTIVSTGNTATVTHTAHGLTSGHKVWIQGATIVGYNGTFTITVTDANTYTYTMLASPASPATGTITATFVVISGLTDVSGDISASFSYAADQVVSGRVRFASSSFYKTAPISGTINSTSGFAATIQMIPDS